MERELRYAVNWRIDDAGLKFIAEREAEGGAVLHTYDDADPQHRPFKGGEPKGTLTIGYGHTRTAKPGMRITEQEALELLRTDIREAESYVHRFVHVPLTQWQYNAMVSIIFNVGPGRLPGSEGPNDKGKSGIIVLTTGRPSSLLEALNQGKYDVAATWFTAWKATKGFEFGLFKRRIAEMLMFMGLPWVRAYLACKSLQFTMAEAIRLGKEELADIQGMQSPAPPPPAPKPEANVTIITDVERSYVTDELVLTKPLKPEVILAPKLPQLEDELVLTIPAASDSGPDANGAELVRPDLPDVQAPKAEENSAESVELQARAEASVPAINSPPAQSGPAQPLPPVLEKGLPPPKPPPIIAPKSVDLKAIPYGEIDPDKGAKNMTDSQRGIGLAIVAIGSVVQILAGREIVSSTIGAVFFDMSRDPAIVAIVAGMVVMFFGWVTRKRGTKVMTDGMKSATQVLK